MMKTSCILPKAFLKINKVRYGKGLKLIGWPFIYRFPKANISIGDKCRINSSFLSNLLGLYQRTIIIAKENGNIEIGDNVGISGATIYARNSIKIGNKTLIGANTKIIDNDFHPINSEDRLNNNMKSLKAKPVIIGKNVFIGCNCIILKGTNIGDNCVIGAGSVVSGTFDANTMIAGNPAKKIKDIS